MGHDLKCWTHEWDAVESGVKRFEVRSNLDRDFAVDDVLFLRKYDPAARAYIKDDGTESSQAGLAETLIMRVTYVLHGGRFGLPPGLCVMGIEPR